MIILPVTPDTLPGLNKLAEKMYSEAALKHLGYNSTRVEQFTEKAMASPFWFLRVGVVDNVVCGAMCGYLTKIIYSDAVLGVEEGIYVEPAMPFRTKMASALLHQFIEWCKENGAVDVRTSVTSGIDNYAADVFYRRNGFQRVGMIYALKNRGDN